MQDNNLTSTARSPGQWHCYRPKCMYVCVAAVCESKCCSLRPHFQADPSVSQTGAAHNQLALRRETTLRQACPLECQGAHNVRSKIRCFTEAAIRITYRSSLRSSSMREPRDPLLKVLNVCVCSSCVTLSCTRFVCVCAQENPG